MASLEKWGKYVFNLTISAFYEIGISPRRFLRFRQIKTGHHKPITTIFALNGFFRANNGVFAKKS